MGTRYQPVDNGYEIIGSREVFNRALYGGHVHDDLTERYFTFAGDQPMIMGAITDWRSEPRCTEAKCGVFMAGVALTLGVRGEGEGDRSSKWFHHSEGTVSTFRNGWMEYQIQPFFQCFPQVKAFVEVLPLMPEDGFLVHLKVWTDQRVVLALGFGGITDFLGSLEFPGVKARNFRPEDCRGNLVACGTNRALVEGRNGESLRSSMWIGTTFATEVSVGDPKLVDSGPGVFLRRHCEQGDTPMARMSCPIGPGETLDGIVVVIRNEAEDVLDGWLKRKDPVGDLKREIRRKQAAIEVHTPDKMLDLTIPSSVVAMDASWHKNAFHHGTYAWHAPYMGWRNWYGPTVIGWHDRVRTAFGSHAARQVTESEGAEETVYEGPHQYYTLRNSTGFIPEILDGGKSIFYNMQEVGVDMFLHHLEWTGDLVAGEEMFDAIARVLDWEARILDPDGDGLYQNWLNTWVSDAHSYNGGGCTQSSAYNYRANAMMRKIAQRLDRDPQVFSSRADRILKALRERLWLPSKGVFAEYIDTVGHKLIHPSPELASIYHPIECGVVDPFEAYQMLRFTETDLRNERTVARGGRLVWSSNWFPQNYSSCGLYTCENIHLAWAYFQCGLTAKGVEILNAIVDAYFLGYNPGMAAHCMTAGGYTEGAQDFSEISSMHLRLVVEGLFGVRFHLLDDWIEIAPNLPADWDHASLKVSDIALFYRRSGQQESLTVWCERPATRLLRLPLRGSRVNSVLLNGAPVEYQIEPGINRCCVVVESRQTGALHLQVNHGEGEVPALGCPREVHPGDRLRIEARTGEMLESRDPSSALSDSPIDGRVLRAKVIGGAGAHTVFVRVRADEWDGWLPADFTVSGQPKPKPEEPRGAFHRVDISEHFNIPVTQIHSLEYRAPSPDGYSIRTRLNGRFGWDWNHMGYCTVALNDDALRVCGGIFRTPSGIPFSTPREGPNAACVSVWDNFPEEFRIPLSGNATELAVLFIGVTNPMQSGVVNGRFAVQYGDGTSQEVSLVNPANFDDWLNAAVQQENETVYWNDYNHAIVQRIPLLPAKELRSLTVRAVANEVIIGILGVSLRRP